MRLKDIISPFYAWKRALEKPFTIKRPVVDREGQPAVGMPDAEQPGHELVHPVPGLLVRSGEGQAHDSCRFDGLGLDFSHCLLPFVRADAEVDGLGVVKIVSCHL